MRDVKKEELIERINALLKDAGYETFVFEPCSTQFCYDLLVKRSNSVFLVKLIPNIDNINESMIESIKALSKQLNSKPLIIGIKNRYQKLEENTLYVREDLPIININTLENILTQDQYPYILARRGGGVIFLDGDLVRSIRERKKISRKELSDEIGVTKRTLCSYESERMRPSQQVAEKIANVLDNEEIYRNINVFDWHFKYDLFKHGKILDEELSDFETHIKQVVEDIGLSSFWYKKGQVPFKMSIHSKDKNKKKKELYPLLSEISEEKKKIQNINIQNLYAFSRLFHRTIIFIVNNDFKVPDKLVKIGIPFIKTRNLQKIDDEKEFIDLLQKSSDS